MTTTQILSAAYADIFDIKPNPQACYYGQRTGDSEIEYAHFDTSDPIKFDIDSDFIEATTEDGSEGCWIGVFLAHYNWKAGTTEKRRIGTIKTLDCGRSAWRNMGALAGELAYVSQSVVWKLYKAEKENSK